MKKFKILEKIGFPSVEDKAKETFGDDTEFFYGLKTDEK